MGVGRKRERASEREKERKCNIKADADNLLKIRLFKEERKFSQRAQRIFTNTCKNNGENEKDN